MCFRNIVIIFSRDLCQAQFIKDSFIFEKSILNKDHFWQDNIKCYKLHVEMCEHDAQFIKTPNKVRFNQPNQDIEYTNNHFYKPAPLYPLFFPCLFYKNKDVQTHNEKMLLEINETLIVLNAIDKCENRQGNFAQYENGIRFLSKVLIKCNNLVEMYVGNYNT